MVWEIKAEQLNMNIKKIAMGKMIGLIDTISKKNETLIPLLEEVRHKMKEEKREI